MSRTAPRVAAWIAPGLMILVALVFGRALYDGFVYDDYYLVQTNAELRAPGGLGHFLGTGIFAGGSGAWATTGARYWRPFLKLAVLVQYRCFGLDARGWHLLSVLVHAASVLLLWTWLQRRLGAASALAAGLGAAVFALHPSRVEAVAWVSGAADLWMTFWVLVGLVAWERRGKVATTLAIAAFVLAALSKETAYVVPLCLAADAWLLRGAAGGERDLRGARGRLAAVALALGGTLTLQLAILPAALHTRTALLWMRPLASLGFLLARLVWPWRPSTQIGLVDPRGGFDFPWWSLGCGGAALLALVCFAIAVRRRPHWRPAAADLAWVVVPLVPVLNLIPLGYTTLVAERFLSLPLVGVAALATRGLVAAGVRRPRFARGLALAGAVLVAAFAVVAAAYVPAFRSNATLWAHELQLQPRNPLLHLYAARAAAAEGRLDEALRAARRSYECAASPDGRTDAAVAWAQLRLQSAGAADLAVVGELRALFDGLAAGNGIVRLPAGGLDWELAPTPEHRLDVTRAVSFRSARAVAHARTGSYAVAATLFYELAQDERGAATFANLARMEAAARAWERAEAARTEGLRLHPGDPGLLGLRGALQRGHDLEAAPPADPQQRAAAWGQLWLEMGLPQRARQEFTSLGCAPEQGEAILVLALTEAALGDAAGARRRIDALRRSDPALARDCDAVQAEIDRQPGSVPSSPRIDAGALFR